MPLSAEQKMALIRAAVLQGRFADRLAPFEAELVETCVDRFRAQGAACVLTANEWRVVQEAVGAMEALREDELRALPTVDARFGRAGDALAEMGEQYAGEIRRALAGAA